MSNYIALNAQVRATCVSTVASIIETGVDETALMARASVLLRERPLIAADVLVGVDRTASLTPAEVKLLRTTLVDLGHTPPGLGPAIDVGRVLSKAADVFETATQDFLVQSVIASLAEPDLGFGIPRVRRAEGVVTLDARRGNSAVLVRVARDGQVERDWLVSEGEDCHLLDDRLDQKLRQRGIDFDVIVEDHHGGRVNEARLFGPALKRDATDLARGALLDAVRPLTPDERKAPTTPAATTPARTRRVVRERA